MRNHQSVPFLAFLCVLACLTGCTTQEPAENPTPAAQPTAAQPTPVAQSIPASPVPPSQLPSKVADTVVKLSTSKGDILIKLDTTAAPISTANFLRYVEDKRYDGTIFHRVISGFMIQGGGFTPQMQKINTYDPIKNEASNGLKNVRGSVAMARTTNPHSATAQFFINHKDNSSLNRGAMSPDGYAVFGHVIKGMDVVDAIAAVPTGRKSHFRDVPTEPMVILSAIKVE